MLTVVQHEIDRIRSMPVVVNTVHESVYKHYHILEYIKKMLERGDSNETILDILSLLESDNVQVPKTRVGTVTTIPLSTDRPNETDE